MEALIPILGLLFLLWLCSERRGSDPDPRDDSHNLRIAQNSDGLYYIYDEENGETIGAFPDMESAADRLKDLQA